MSLIVNSDCHFDECHFDQCRYIECHYAECRGGPLHMDKINLAAWSVGMNHPISEVES